MTLKEIEVTPNALTVHWSDGESSLLPGIWLRDNCPSGFHKDTGERTFDLLSVPENPTIVQSSIVSDQLEIDWDDGHRSSISLNWLALHQPGKRAEDPADIAPIIWPQGMKADSLPRHRASDIVESDQALNDWMVETAQYGVSIVEGLEDSIDAGIEVAQRIGFLRQTNFGKVFEVVSKPDPNNLAYTSHALPLHTDLPNQEVPPGYQFLHCLANEAQGGGSVFADGFAIAEHLRETDPSAFALLSETDIPFRFHDTDTDIRVHSPVIVLDRHSRLREVRYNAHIASIFDMPADQIDAYYKAYRAYMTLTRDREFQLTLKLKAGEMVVFDNRRALHGREAFDPSTGFRHLHGCYVDRGEFSSRLRVLNR